MDNEAGCKKDYSPSGKISPFCLMIFITITLVSIIIMHAQKKIFLNHIQILTDVNDTIKARLRGIENAPMAIQDSDGDYILIFHIEILENISGKNASPINQAQLVGNPCVRLAIWKDGNSGNAEFINISGQSGKIFCFAIAKDYLKYNLALQIMHTDGTWTPLEKDGSERHVPLPDIHQQHPDTGKEWVAI